MSRTAKWVLVAVLVLGAMFYLQSRVGEQPVVRQEKQVDLNALR